MAKHSFWTNKPTRRDILAAFLGVPLALAGCSRKQPPLPDGEIVGASEGIGHRLRDGFRPALADDQYRKVGVVIVGAGIAGLTAAWRMQLRDQAIQPHPFNDFVILELEPAAGGTSRSGSSAVTRYPWGAHYLPVPMKESTALIRLLREMNVVQGEDSSGQPVVAEQYLIRDPEQRIFHRGLWYTDDEPYLRAGQTSEDVAQRMKFYEEVDRWVRWRDGKGRRAFTLPISNASDDAFVTELDRMSMAEWLNQRGLTSPRLRWMVNYACRDDYGATLEDVSAWSGLFYFASRKSQSHTDSQPYMAWPEGNGRFVDHFLGKVKDRLQVGLAVSEVIPTEGGARVIAVDHAGKRVIGYQAKKVIFAAPQFLAPYLIRPSREHRSAHLSHFEYSAWMVANVHLKDRPRGGMLAWDNIIYDSPSLGYVVATHQLGSDHGPTVLTYYYPLTEGSPEQARSKLLHLDWQGWAEVVLTDLEQAHPDIRRLVTRLDVMRWGHAMPRPRPGAIWSSERRKATRPLGPIHFAHSDLSGVGVMEEAFYHGVRAAEEALTALEVQTRSLLARWG